MRSRAAIAVLLIAIAANVFAGRAAGANGVRAVPAGDFLNSVGVCTHIGQGIDNASQSAAALAYSGVRNIRDDGVARHVPDWISVHKKTGVKVVLTWTRPIAQRPLPRTSTI